MENYEKLSTIQKKDKLNTVYRADEVGPGNGYHDYVIADGQTNDPICFIQFQKGPRKEEGSRRGVIDEDLLEIVRDRLKAFQSGPYATRENACALTHIEEALMWMNKRKEDRAERGVLGTYQK